MLERTIGDETIRGVVGVPFVPLVVGVVDVDVENRANNGGSGATGATAGGEVDVDVETAATKAGGTGFTGASLFFLRRKPAIKERAVLLLREVKSEKAKNEGGEGGLMIRHEEYKHSKLICDCFEVCGNLNLGTEGF